MDQDRQGQRVNGEMMRSASIFGGNWYSGDNAGSRYANLDYWPENSNENISARGRSDDPFSARRSFSGHGHAGPSANATSAQRRMRRGGQPGHPASANTLLGPVQRGVAGIACRNPRPASEAMMGKKHRNLIERITADATMLEALRLTSRGKRLTPARLEFKEFSSLNLDRLAHDMRTGAYVQGEPHQFNIFDPKLRTISALPFRDRIAQHALFHVIAPIFDTTLLPRTFACRPGKGTHAAAHQLQSDIRRLTRNDEPLFVLKTDFSKYFASIDRAVLWRLIEAKISCRATLRLIEAMLPRQGIGLPIGSLVSQIFANVYGGIVDRHLQQDLGERYWHRYMDDIVILGRSSEHLARIRLSIEALSREQLGLRFSKWSIQPASRGVNFVGYRIWATHKLLRRDSVTRARRKIRAYRAAGDHDRLQKFLASWTGHAGWADSFHLMRSLGLEEKLNG
jgi:RNA-directed DNA polymerase